MSRPIYVDLTFPKNVDFKFAYYITAFSLATELSSDGLSVRDGLPIIHSIGSTCRSRFTELHSIFRWKNVMHCTIVI